MESHLHLLVAIFGSIGLMLSSWLIDIDHSGSVSSKIDCILHPTNCGDKHPDIHRGIFHKPIVAFSIIAFFFCFSIGYLIHLLMDYLKFVN